MRNFVGTAFFLIMLATGIFVTFHQLDPDFRLQFDKQLFQVDPLSISPGSVSEKVKSPHVRRSEADWTEIDGHAMEIPENVSHDLASLVRQICIPAKDEWEKARGIYRWITEHISYDDAAFNSGVYGLHDPVKLLVTRKGVCDDFADLFKAMALEAGIKAEKVTGYAKGYGYVPGQHFPKPDHAWNAIFIDDDWHLVDATWGQGFGTPKHGKLVTTKKFKDAWFDTDPSEFAFKHLPEDPKWQLLEEPLSLAEFESMPEIGPEFFALGYEGKGALEEARKGNIEAFPTLFDNPFHVKVIKAPLRRFVDAGEPLVLTVDCADCKGMGIWNAGKMKDMDTTDAGYYTYSLKPKAGPIRIFGKKRKNDIRYEGILEFEARKALKVR